MSSVTKSYSLNKSATDLYINEDTVTSNNTYDEKGNAKSKGVLMEQNGNKVSIAGSTSSSYTLLDCDASLSGWRKSDNQFAYSEETYSSSDVVRIDFKNADPTLSFQDLAIGFGGADNIQSVSSTFNFFGDSSYHLNSIDNFYFWLSPPSYNSATFTILYDGKDNVSRYINGVLQNISTITFNTWFPGGLKIYAVFNNGEGGTNYHYKVKLYQPTAVYPARSLLCKNMGKKYVLNNDTYVKVQNIAGGEKFFVNMNEKLFVSCNF